MALLGEIFAKANEGDPWAALELIANVTANVPEHKLRDESFLRASIINSKGIAKACLEAHVKSREPSPAERGER